MVRFRIAAMAAIVTAALWGGVGPVIPAAADNSGEVPYAIAPTLPSNLQAFLAVETSQSVFNVDYHYAHVDPASNGAYERNVGSTDTSWYVEDQRYGEGDVIGGVLHDDIGLLETGLKMFDFALEREAPNGSFPGSDYHGLFHGTAFFLAAAGPAMIVLREWVLEPTLPDNLPRHINWEIGRLNQAATYLVDAWWNKPGHIDDGGKEERRFEAAVALQSVGVLAANTWLEQRASVYAQAGARMTEPNGVWTEHGITSLCCHDSSYQAIGLVYAARYLTLIPPKTSLYDAVYRAIDNGETWEFSRTSLNGAVNRTGDDRTGPTCPEGSTAGGCKAANYQAISSALMRWYAISGDFTFNRRAYRVWIREWMQFPGSKMPPPGLNIFPHTSLSVTNIEYHLAFFVSGTRFEPVEPVKAYFGSVLVGQTTTDQIGSFGGHSSVANIQFTPAVTTDPGKYTVKVVGQYGITRTAQVTITPGPPLNASVNPGSLTSAQAGQFHWPVLLAVTGFKPYDKVSIYWGPALVGTYTCDLTGAFGGSSGTGPYGVHPPTSAPGKYAITVEDDSERDASVAVQITD